MWYVAKKKVHFSTRVKILIFAHLDRQTFWKKKSIWKDHRSWKQWKFYAEKSQFEKQTRSKFHHLYFQGKNLLWQSDIYFLTTKLRLFQTKILQAKLNVLFVKKLSIHPRLLAKSKIESAQNYWHLYAKGVFSVE